VNIKFSRHAKRRAQLYKLSMPAIEKIVKGAMLSEGEHEIIHDIAGVKFPVKICVAVEGNVAAIITNYPLKKGHGNENSL
jgi:hypothetical protein